MGVKRPFDEELQEPSFKQAKRLGSNYVQTSLTGSFSSDEFSETAHNQGEAAANNFDKFILLKDFGNEDSHVTSSLADKELGTGAPLSWVTSSSSEEDAGYGELFNLPPFCEFYQFNFPRRSVAPLKDGYSSRMHSSPSREIPIGPNHQADIPVWDPKTIDDDNKRFLGTCIISPSASKDSSGGDVKTGLGRRECDCLDGGSVRCVRQHVKKARDELREVMGDKKFSDLGFCDMGDEVACKWSEEEEAIFHEVIYNNPASLGKDFWKQLPLVFPSRSMKDIVSYYFNVFILWRRAVQNRSNTLEIDSDDDDEWHTSGRRFFGPVKDDDEDSVVESFGDGDAQVGSEDDVRYDDEDDDDSNDGDGDGGEVDGIIGEDINDKDHLRGQNLKSHTYQIHDDASFDFLLGNVNPGEVKEDHNLEEASTTSCESQLYTGPSDVGHDARESKVTDDFTGYLTGESSDSSGHLDSEFLVEPGDVKVWDETCPPGFARSVDFLPTWNMIEEIFGSSSSSMSN